MNRVVKVMYVDVEAIHTHGRTLFVSLGVMASVNKKVGAYIGVWRWVKSNV